MKNSKFMAVLVDFTATFPIGKTLTIAKFRDFFTKHGLLEKLPKNASSMIKLGYVAKSSALLQRINKLSTGERYSKFEGAVPFHIAVNPDTNGVYDVLNFENAIEHLASKRLIASHRRVSLISATDDKLINTANALGFNTDGLENAKKTTQLQHVNILRAMKKIGIAHNA